MLACVEAAKENCGLMRTRSSPLGPDLNRGG